MKNTIRFLTVLLCAVMLVSATVIGVSAAENQYRSNNKNDQNYTTYGTVINSYLSKEGDGYVRAEYKTSHDLVVEYYDQNREFLSRTSIDLPLTLFGGVYMCEDANFVVCGQKNSYQDNEKEVIRVIRYSKDWKEEGYASLYGANTISPFNAGSLRFARSGDILFIRTCHKMYQSSDGQNHQANLTLRVRVSDMKLLDSYHSITNTAFGYCSHSFNQFIRSEDDVLIAVDHGDAYPRGVALYRYTDSATTEKRFNYRSECVNVLPIVGDLGDNSTGVSVGGFEYSSSHYLVAGNTIEQKAGNSYKGQRNIFVTATSKAKFTQDGTLVHYITSYEKGENVSCTTPHLVKLSSDRFLLMWGEGSYVRYCFLDGAGNMLGDIYSIVASLSDCAPIVCGDSVIWYVTNSSVPQFYELNIQNQDFSDVHFHAYDNTIQKLPTEDAPGVLHVTCSVCGEEKDVELPPVSAEEYSLAVWWEPRCQSEGLTDATWNNTEYGKVFFRHKPPALGCIGDNWELVKNATCQENGLRQRVCERCNQLDKEVIPAGGHVWDAGSLVDGILTRTCTVCAEVSTEFLLPEVSRIYGATRYDTAIAAANVQFELNNDEKFWNIVVACGSNFPDALSGTYLAAVKQAPILLVKNGNISQIRDYISEHLAYSGTVYLLGDASVVPDKICENLRVMATVKRLGGKTRYETNLAILQEAGVQDQDILICTGKGFADSLSASAVGKPILLVKDALSDQQKTFLAGTTGKKIIIGGTGAVSQRVEEQLKTYGEVSRIGGKTRYETSVLVAEAFFENPTHAVLAYGQNFPDGLSGGPLAYKLNAPLILTANGKDSYAASYTKSRWIVQGYVLGGPTLISDKTAKNIFSADSINVK